MITALNAQGIVPGALTLGPPDARSEISHGNRR
jgi:hypothetical protein